MRSTIVLALALFVSLSLSGCRDPLGPETPKAQDSSSGSCDDGIYIGDVNGQEATANVSFEQLPEYTVMSGEITSPSAYYTFTADIIGERGWGDMVDHSDGSRFRVQIDMISNGFLLTSNPFLSPTTYTFTCTG